MTDPASVDWAAYVDIASAAIGLPIDPSVRAGVVANLERMAQVAQALEGGVRLRDELFGRADLFAEHRDARATREALCGRRVSSAPAGASQSAAVPCDRVC